MVWLLSSAKRREKLSQQAALSRASTFRRHYAWAAVIIYNLVGFADIASTVIALDAGAGEEANPFLRLLMENWGDGWVLAKLFLQGVISFMVLWFPHWFVLGFFTAAVTGNALIVYNNFVIGGVF